MLWYKGWLETRVKLLLSVGFMLFLAVFTYSVRNSPPPGGTRPVAGVALMAMSFLTMACALLAGAGINTQAAFQATKGLHGSTLFTLSLPVSRLELLAARASLGWIEMAGVLGAFCCGIWFASPPFRAIVSPIDMFKYAGTLIICGSALYSVSVLLATFLDDIWRVWGTIAAFGVLWLISSRLPSQMNIIQAMQGSSLSSHVMPWSAMSFSVGLAAILLLASLKIVQSRQY